MFNADVLTFREFVMHEPLPLATIQETILEFLRGRRDVALFGAQAVNAYVDEPRMTQDIDLLSFRARELAQELCELLSAKFHIAVRVRNVGEGKGFRIYQIQKSNNRHLADVRLVAQLPETRTVEGINVVSPAELIASKVVSYHARRGRPKAGTDWRDLAVLLLKFPELKNEVSAVTVSLQNSGAQESILQVWRELIKQEIRLETEDEDLNF
jgi:hypothetical protein